MIISTIIVLPFLLFLGVLMFYKYKGLKFHKAFGNAADITAPLLVISVAVTYQAIFEQSILSVVLLFVLVVASIMSFVEWKTKKEIELPKLYRKISRLIFLLFSFLLIVFWLIGLLQTLWTYWK